MDAPLTVTQKLGDKCFVYNKELDAMIPHDYELLVSAVGLKGNPHEILLGLCHSIRNPAASICGYTDLIKKLAFENNMDISPFQDLLDKTAHICITFRDLIASSSIYDKFPYPDEEAQQLLNDFLGCSDMLEVAYMSAVNALKLELPPMKIDIIPFINTLCRIIINLWNYIAVYANPGEPDVPSDYLALRKALFNINQRAAYHEPNALPLFLQATHHELNYFRVEGTVGLRHFADEQALDRLIELLHDDNESIINIATESLEHLKNPKAIPALKAQLERNFQHAWSYKEVQKALAAIEKG